MYAWADLGSDGSASCVLFVEVEDGCNDGLGGQKSADITPEAFLHHLNAAPGKLTERGRDRRSAGKQKKELTKSLS